MGTEEEAIDTERQVGTTETVATARTAIINQTDTTVIAMKIYHHIETLTKETFIQPWVTATHEAQIPT